MACRSARFIIIVKCLCSENNNVISAVTLMVFTLVVHNLSLVGMHCLAVLFLRFPYTNYVQLNS